MIVFFLNLEKMISVFYRWVGCSPRGHEELDTTEQLHFHFSLSCIGEGNGNSLQCSCLENPRDGGAWWAAVYGVAQSQTRLKQLGSSSRIKTYIRFQWRKGCKPTGPVLPRECVNIIIITISHSIWFLGSSHSPYTPVVTVSSLNRCFS